MTEIWTRTYWDCDLEDVVTESCESTPEMRLIKPLRDALYQFSCVGGNLHIVLDDGNVGDSDLEFCRREIERSSASDAQKHAERTCLEALMQLQEYQRNLAISGTPL